VARQALTAKSDLDLVDVHTMPKKATTSAVATDMGPITRSRSVPDTVGEVPLTAEQEERNIQAALAQTANDAATRSRSMQDTVGGVPLTAEQEEHNIQVALAQTAKDADARKVARDTLNRRARLHNLKIKETGGDGHCLQYSVQDQLAQQGIVGQTMQVLRTAMAAFIEDKAEYFKQFLTAEEHESKAWKGLLADIRHSVGNAKRWGGDLEISALSNMFQCPIQYVTSRQGHEFEEFVTMNPNASLLGWWRKFKKQHNLPVDFYLGPLTLIYEEMRHWQSSEPLIPQVGPSAAGRTAFDTQSEPLIPQVGKSAAGRSALATPSSSEGVLGDEEPAARAPADKARGKSKSSAAPISTLPGPPNGLGRLSRSISRSNTANADSGLLSQASGSNVPVSLLPRPLVNDNFCPPTPWHPTFRPTLWWSDGCLVCSCQVTQTEESPKDGEAVITRDLLHWCHSTASSNLCGPFALARFFVLDQGPGHWTNLPHTRNVLYVD